GKEYPGTNGFKLLNLQRYIGSRTRDFVVRKAPPELKDTYTYFNKEITPEFKLGQNLGPAEVYEGFHAAATKAGGYEKLKQLLWIIGSKAQLNSLIAGYRLV